MLLFTMKPTILLITHDLYNVSESESLLTFRATMLFSPQLALINQNQGIGNYLALSKSTGLLNSKLKVYTIFPKVRR